MTGVIARSGDVCTSRNKMGVSQYKTDYMRRYSVSQPYETLTGMRRNRPHPNQDFLLPRQLNDGIELQKKVRRAVREYLDEIYSRSQSNFSLSQTDGQESKRRNFDKLNRPHSNYTKSPSPFPGVSGRPTVPDQLRPSTAVSVERAAPCKEVESKRERSVRIAEEISKKNRIKTAHPQPGRWQVNRSSLSDTKYPSYKQAVNKRAVSAPPSVQEYTFYNQSPKQQDRQPDMYKPIHDKLHAWADSANDYEKQVIYNMLSRATKPDNATPSTPPSPREAYHILSRSKSVAAPPPPPQEIVNKDRAGMTASWSPYFKLQQTKHRKTNSAPVKHMLDLVPAATQYPPRDQRSYRLKGQDPRLRENPAEEKMLRGYLDKMARITGNQAIKPEKKFLIVPMHSYKRKKGMDKDYKCDVSFFQSVRAPFKSHFVIHPDFTSEKFAQKKHANQMISHFRY